MENITKLIHDIFSMSFDVVVPVSGLIVAVAIGFVLFFIRYFTFERNRKKYENRQRKAEAAARKEQAETKVPVPAGAEITELEENSTDKAIKR